MDFNNLNLINLKKVFSKLKKDSKQFSELIVRDPTDFLDYEIELESNLSYLIKSIKSNNYSPNKPIIHKTAKSKGINRPTGVLDINDALVYRFCISQIEDELLSKTRQRNIRGGIKISKIISSEEDEYYEKWFEDWSKHQENLRKALNNKPFLVTTDIASYFENISILILKDSIRSDVSGKAELLNLLFYFLENITNRDGYEVNTNNGLLQESIDASRLLAYYFLRSHDENMKNFCSQNKAEYYRFVDDMSVTVESEVMGRKALKAITESLRKLNLMSSVEKTEIVSAEKAKQELFFEEHDSLNPLQEEIIKNIHLGLPITRQELKVRKILLKLEKTKKFYKNWHKILKRFYTISSIGGFDLFSEKILEQIIFYPLIFSDKKILKYVLRQNNKTLNSIVKKLLDYLKSEENLYQQLETNLLELFLAIPVEKYTKDNIELLIDLASVFLRPKQTFSPQSNYSIGLACLLIYKFNQNVQPIAQKYLTDTIDDPLLKKYLIMVAVTVENYNLREKVLQKAKKEQNPSVQRLVKLVENANVNYKSIIFRKLKEDMKIYIHSDSKKKIKITEIYDNVRARVISDILNIYS